MTKSPRRGFVLLAIAVTLLVMPATATAARYVVTDLGSLGGTLCLSNPGQTASYALALNASGQVSGGACARDPFERPIHAFRWTAGSMLDLGVPSGFVFSEGNAINDAGDVAGTASTSFIFELNVQAFVWRGGTLTPLVDPSLGGSKAADINSAGDVVGTLTSAGEAFLHTGGRLIRLGALGGSGSFARAINDAGQVVGRSDPEPNVPHAFLYEAGAMRDLGPGDAVAINERGDVVINEGVGVRRLQAGTTQDLGTLGGTFAVGFGINSAGDVVGTSGTASFQQHAFIYSRGMHDLNDLTPTDSSWVLTEARAVNDAGQIVGSGTFGGDQRRAFLLTPTTTEPLPDVTPPELTVPSDITVGAQSASGTEVSFVVTATDPDDAPSTPECTPASGSVFPVGTTTVTCTSNDTNGNVGRATFKVNVDGTPPTPFVFDFRAEATDPSGATVEFEFSAVDDFDPAPKVTCTPPSGSFFAVGETILTCVARDAFGNESPPVTAVLTVLAPLGLVVTLDKTGTVARGAATISGKLFCGRAASVDVSGEIVQDRKHQGIALAFFGATVNCVPPRTRWRIQAVPLAEPFFRPGFAGVRVTATHCDLRCVFASDAGQVLLGR
jgi:probable HAF family extracellular repeat protein